MVSHAQKLSVNQRIREDELLWSQLPDEFDDPAANVPEGEIVSLDLVPQASFPSPDYETEEAVNNLDPYLSPRGEEMMNFSSDTEMPSGSQSQDVDNLGLGSVSFDDLLDSDYVLNQSSLNAGIEAELEQFLSGKTNTANDDVVSDLCLDQNENISSKNGSDDMSLDSDDSDYKPIEKKTSGGKYSLRSQRPGRVHSSSSPSISSASKKHSSIIVVKQVPAKERGAPRTVPKLEYVVPSTKSTSSPQTRQKNSFETISSDKFEDDEVDKSRRNAIQARLNRQKKKAYIQGLEKQVNELSKENQQLQSESTRMKKDVSSLEQEVCYLRSVLANESALAKMLGNLSDVRDVKLTSSFKNDRKRSASDMDHDYGCSMKQRRGNVPAPRQLPTSGGVCLHVEKNNVSMEFCSKCAQMARGASRSEVS